MINTSGLLVVILLLVFLIYILRNKTLDNFIIFIDDVIIPKTCYNYLVTNGKDFFLLNTNKILDDDFENITCKCADEFIDAHLYLEDPLKKYYLCKNIYIDQILPNILPLFQLLNT